MHARGLFGMAMMGAVCGCNFGYGEPVAYAELTSASIDDPSSYPHTTFEGREVYLVGKTWMFEDGGRWAYYREEPEQLRRYRLVAIEGIDPSTVAARSEPPRSERRGPREDRFVRDR